MTCSTYSPHFRWLLVLKRASKSKIASICPSWLTPKPGTHPLIATSSLPEIVFAGRLQCWLDSFSSGYCLTMSRSPIDKSVDASSSISALWLLNGASCALPAGTAGMPCPVEVCWLCPSVWLDESPLLSPETLITGELSSAIMTKRSEVDTEVWLGCKHLWGTAIGGICIYQLLTHVNCANITGYLSTYWVSIMSPVVTETLSHDAG